MPDYVAQRPLPKQFPLKIHFFNNFFIIFCFLSVLLPKIHSYATEKNQTKILFDFKNAVTAISQIQEHQQHYHNSQSRHRKHLRIVVFRGQESSKEENNLFNDSRSLAESYGINLTIEVFDQSSSLSMHRLCSIIKDERRDTILLASLYTKEIDFLSRSLKLPTIALTNRYDIVQGKLHNPYLFKLMPDSAEAAKFAALAIDTRSLYTRIALIYDVSLDMLEYRLTYLKIAKQFIVYRAQLPRISVNQDFQKAARTIIIELTEANVDLIFCIMSTSRQTQFINSIKQLKSPQINQLLFNETSWWFASRISDAHDVGFLPRILTVTEDRQRAYTHFSIINIKIILNSILKTYNRLCNLYPGNSSSLIGPQACDRLNNDEQMKKTQMFIKLFTNFTEWSCELRLGYGVDPLLFYPKTLAWRIPFTYIVHEEHQCRGMLVRTFSPNNVNAEQFFRSCRSVNSTSRKSSASNQDNGTTSSLTVSPNALLNIENYLQVFSRVWNGSECRFLRIDSIIRTPIVIGVVEPPYIFISDSQISSEFHCNYGILCHQIDPPLPNQTIDPFIFYSKSLPPAQCCYGISVNILLRMEDSNLIPALKTTRLFVYADKPNKWSALIKALENRRAHLSISPIPYESFMNRSIDLSPPFYHSSYVILRAPLISEPFHGAFLQPFSWGTWCIIFLILTATSVFETFFEWHSPYGLTPRGRRRKAVFSLASALTLSWSIIFSHTFKTKSPKCWSNRFLGNVWGGFGIVFIAIYTAKLAAFMVDMTENQTPTTIKDVANECTRMTHCTIGVIANSTDEEYFKRNFSSTLYRYVQYVPSYSHGIDLLRNYSITYLLMDHSMARYYLTRDTFKLISATGDNFGRFGISMGFSKFDSDLKVNITKILISYVDKGIIQRLHDDWYVYENCEMKRLNQNRMLSAERFIGVFILLAVGVVVGVLTLSVEWITFKYVVPYWRRKGWPGWMFCSQRLYATLNAPEALFNEAYGSSEARASRCVGERLHNYSTRSDSLDLRVVDVPRLICSTYQLKEEMRKMLDQKKLRQSLRSNGDLYSSSKVRLSTEEFQTIKTRIEELEEELDQLRERLAKLEET